MNPAGPAWPRLQVLWALFPLLAVLLSPWSLWAVEECTWQVALNKFETVGTNLGSDRFFDQEPLDTVDSLFGLLVDAPIDPDEKYMSFPYYLKINYSCKGEICATIHHHLILGHFHHLIKKPCTPTPPDPGEH